MDKNHVRQHVLEVVKDLRKQGLSKYNTNTSRIVNDTIKKVKLKRAIIGLNTPGCSYGKNLEGCFHCGYLKGYGHLNNMYNQFLEDVKQYAGQDTICLYSNGSFFDPEEIPHKLQKKMLVHLVDSGFKRIIVETRPDFITEAHLNDMLKSIPSEYLKIGLGFDTYSDDIRDVCLNKGFTRHQYDDAARILNKNDIIFETRIVLKPPFLTEDEAIKEALLSIEHAFKKGSNEVSLEPVAIQDYTLQDYLRKKGFYRVPWLWSVISIIRDTHYKGRIVVGGEAFLPLPKEIAHNCNKCSDSIWQAIYNFNKTQDLTLFDRFECNCIEDWKKDLNTKDIPLFNRIIYKINGE
jgi:radical SAM enzyme (TIGR01210 family)